LKPFYADDSGSLYCGDCIEAMRELPDNSVDAVVTDPPYGLQFMGKEWDSFGNDLKKLQEFSRQWATECLRVLKPGGYLLSFGGSRTAHRIFCGIEDAGFELRDVVMWLYGSGFPKSLNVGKAIDKAAGVEFSAKPACSEDWHQTKNQLTRVGNSTAAAKQWDGWGTALKPAYEPVCVARKPISEKTVAANVLKWGTGAMNIDGCRVGTELRVNAPAASKGNVRIFESAGRVDAKATKCIGRFPANLIHDGSEEVVRGFPKSKGGAFPKIHGSSSFVSPEEKESRIEMNDSGSAARFFYCAKASRAERAGSIHPTIKPLALMQYLIKLVTPPKGIVLDPFAGSGTTLVAAKMLGNKYIGIEREEAYLSIAAHRISAVERRLF
jgi:DNA modification methylase